MDRENPRKNAKSKAIQAKSHKEAYTYTQKEKKGKIYIYKRRGKLYASDWLWKCTFSIEKMKTVYSMIFKLSISGIFCLHKR